jgi:hypothetical protein
MSGEQVEKINVQPSNGEKYMDVLRADIEKLEGSVLPSTGRKLSLLGSMDAAHTEELRQQEMRNAHMEYGELVSKRMEYFLRSPETNGRIKGLWTELHKRSNELAFPQTAIEMINRLFKVFAPGRPNKQGQITTPMLMTYQKISRVHVGGALVDHLRDIDAYMEIATPAQKEYLARLRGLIVNGDKPVGDVSWSATNDGVMDIDPIAKAELAFKQMRNLDPADPNLAAKLADARITPEVAGAQKGWSQLGLTTRFFGTVAASGMAVTAFLSNKRVVDWPVAAYAGLALLGANGMPKGKFDAVIDQVKPLLSEEFVRLSDVYDFHEQPKDWSDLALKVNGFRKNDVKNYNKLMRPIEKGATEEERRKGLEAFVKLLTKEGTPVHAKLKANTPADFASFAAIVTTSRNRDAQIIMRQYFEKNLGPHQLQKLAPK